MNTLYLDTFSGISGDMFIGALLDLGVDFHQLEHALEQLRLDGYHLHVHRSSRRGIEGSKFDVHLESEGHSHSHSHSHPGEEHDHPHEGDAHAHEHSHTHEHTHGHSHEHGHSHSHEHSHPHDHEQEQDHQHQHGRSFAEIRELIAASNLSDWVKRRATSVFQRIAVAEGKVHGCSPEEVAFHEVGALDSIIDIVGGCIGLELLGKPRVLASLPVEGTGWVDCEHGRFPIPAPATLSILGARGVPLSQCDEPHELITPTGAALLAEFVETFGPLQQLIPEKIGYGVGTRENKNRPNVLRAILGSSSRSVSPEWETDRVAVLETNLDDINSEVLGYVMEKAFAEGALDVFHTPVQMKKNRPGVLLSILCDETAADRLTELLLTETTAFGVRRYRADRAKLARESVKVQTPFGDVTVKVGRLGKKIVQVSPEFESCKQIANAAAVPIKEVYAAALRAGMSSTLSRHS